MTTLRGLNSRPRTSDDLKPGDMVVAKQYDMVWTSVWENVVSGGVWLGKKQKVIPFPSSWMLVIGKRTERSIYERTFVRYALLTRDSGIIELDTNDLEIGLRCVITLEKVR